MVDVAQLVRALVCGTRGRGFESHLPPKADADCVGFFCAYMHTHAHKNNTAYQEDKTARHAVLEFFIAH